MYDPALGDEYRVLSSEEEADRDRALRDFRFFCRRFLKIKPKRDDDDKLINPELKKLGPLIPFVWNEAQEIVWGVMCEMMRAGIPIKLVICKARQFGISTLFCAWIFWQMWRQLHTRAMIACFQKKTTLNELNETMNTFYESFPDDMRPTLRDRRRGGRLPKDDVYFLDRKADLKFVIATKDSARGMARDLALCTEVSSYPDPEEFFGGFIPVLSENTWSTLVVESSPKDGFFWEVYKGARDRREDGRRAVFLPWWIVPKLYSLPLRRTNAGFWRDARTGTKVTFDREEKKERDELTRLAERQNRPPISAEQMYWRQKRIEAYGGDVEYFNQEYPRDDISCFMRSTRSAFKICLPMAYESSKAEAIEAECPEFAMGELHSETYEDPSLAQTVTFVEEPRPGWIDQEFRAGLCIYHDRNDKYTYTIGADVADESEAGGDDDDESAFSVVCVYCCNTREQVAEWRGKLDPHDFGDVIVKIGYYYNTALVNVEYNNMGVTTIDRLTRYLAYPNRFRWPKLDEAGKLTKKEMWVTDERTKLLMIGQFRWAVKAGFFKIRSPGLYDEMAAYRIKNGRYKVGAGAFADRIVAASLAWQGVEQSDVKPYMTMVMGSVVAEAEKQSAAGQARRVTHMTGKKPIVSVPRELPVEFGELAKDVQRVEDIWEMAAL
jgi:hypothetical protein